MINIKKNYNCFNFTVHVSRYFHERIWNLKHGILKCLRNNKNIVIMRPDKGNGVVVMDRNVYNQKMYELIDDRTKFRKLDNDPTILREGQLQRYLRNLKKLGFFDEKSYENVYPSGSQPSRLYGLPKIHKVKDKNNIPPFRPIVS